MSENGHDAAEVYRRAYLNAEAYQRRAREAADTATRLRSEADQLAAQAEAWESRRSELEARAAQAGAAEQGARRSEMTPAQISAFIRTRIAAGRTGQQAREDFSQLPK